MVIKLQKSLRLSHCDSRCWLAVNVAQNHQQLVLVLGIPTQSSRLGGMFPVLPGAPSWTWKRSCQAPESSPYSHLFTSTSISMCATPPGMQTLADTQCAKTHMARDQDSPLQGYCALSNKHTFPKAQRCGSSTIQHNSSAQTHLQQQHGADATSAEPLE